jgi:signal transduction histidine kinase
MINFSTPPNRTALTYSSFAVMDRDNTPELLRQRIIELMLTCADASALLSAIARVCTTVFQADACLVIANPQSRVSLRTLMVLYRDNQSQALSPQTMARYLDHPLFAAEAVSTDILAFDDIQATDLDDLDDIFPARSLLRARAYSQGQVNGTIAIARAQLHSWSDREIDLLNALRDPLALAFDRIALQQQVETSRRHQDLLNRLSAAISNTPDLDRLLQLALVETGRAFAIDRAWLVELKYDNPLFVQRQPQAVPAATATAICDWSSRERPSYVGRSFRLQQCWFCAQAWQTLPHPLAMANCDLVGDRTTLEIPTWAHKDEQQALLVLPLFGRSSANNNPARILGFLILQDSQPRAWTEADIELATWVSTQLSTATLNNQALQQVRDLVDERTAQLKWSLDVQAKLSEKMRQQIDQLQHLNQLKDEFLDTIQHELKTPLATMKMAIRMLRQPGLPPERQEKYLEILEQEWQREDSLIQDLLALQKLESNQFALQPQRLDLKSFIDSITEPLLTKWQKKKLRLQTTYTPDEEAIAAYIDPDSLERVLTELLTNAGKYAEAQTTIQLEVERSRQTNGELVILRVTNTGLGIDPDDLENIFEKFHRGKGVTAQAIQGTGLGLALVKSLVNHLNGTIEVRSHRGETCFTVSIPQSRE